ncbi:LAMI_0D12464g1_1 [Lachancea mirantina]|uniref:LAMI_0D12464g1_1 n=1 Tax=Lachancea mirantina TaxID=1230905 RepID=A0A1G4JFQ9_9SACH|nr:LAMI_0D12464g1_1 [Lachancea mirantina]
MTISDATSDSTGSREYAKLLSRRDELLKQETSLKREYTTLLRKMASVMAVLQTIDNDNISSVSISEESVTKVPGLAEYAELIAEIDATDFSDVEIPDFLQDSYQLFKNAALLYKDA